MTTLQQQIAAARRHLAQNPEDPASLLELAESLVQHHRLTGEGSLDEAIASARRARRLWPGHAPALFLEAASQGEAGRTSKAAALYEEYLASRRPGRHGKRMRKEAEAFLAAWSQSTSSSP